MPMGGQICRIRRSRRQEKGDGLIELEKEDELIT